VVIDFMGVAYPVVYAGPDTPLLERTGLLAFDTETPLIENAWEYPEMVLLQLFNGKEVHLIGWRGAGPYLERLFQTVGDGELWVAHNVAFDVGVMRRFMSEYHKPSSGEPDPFTRLADNDLLHDTGLMYQLRLLAGAGDGREDYPSLAEVVRKIVGYDMDKNADVRLTFNKSRAPSPRHLKYAAIDAIATWHAALKMVGRDHKHIPKTSSIQTRGALALDAVSKEGMLVNRKLLAETANRVHGELSEARRCLRDFGVVMNDGDLPKGALERLDGALENLSPLIARCKEEEGWEPPLAGLVGKTDALMECVNKTTKEGVTTRKVTGLAPFLAAVATLMGGAPGESTAETTLNILRLLGVEAEPREDGTTKPLTQKQAAAILWYYTKFLGEGEPVKEARLKVGTLYTDYFGWSDSCEGPDTAIQRMLGVVETELGIEFPKTATGKISTDETALAEFPTDHPFLKALKTYKGHEKLLSTYLTDKHIHPDGRVHPRFNVLMRTGRTSASKPNTQNLPKFPGVREMYVCPEDHYLLAADYSQQELGALAHSCHVRFGESRMRDVINAGLDLHSWATLKVLRIKGLPDPNPDDPGTIKCLDAAIKDYGGVGKDRFDYLRTLSKALNFGKPGGLGNKSFVAYAAGYGVTLSEEEAVELGELWKESFPEMRKHLNPVESALSGAYVATTVTGRARDGASFCAACNTIFQGFAADISKTALWEVVKRGYRPCNFVHDEILAYLPSKQAHIQVGEDQG